VRQRDEVRVNARVVLVSTDLATHRAMALPDDLRQAVTDFGPRSQSETRSRSTTT
jgi:acyl-CoA thioesterase FadM